jgi:hypothetical protein
MANINEIQSLLAPLPISTSSESDDRFTFELFGNSFYIPKSEVDHYLAIKDKIVSNPTTSIFYPGYYEHMLEYRSHISVKFGWEKDDIFHLENQDNTLSVKISLASSPFLLHVIQEMDSKDARRRLALRYMSSRDKGSRTQEHWSTAFRRMRTIQVSSLKEDSMQMSREKFLQIAESALFHIAYGSGDGFYLSHSWERTYHMPLRWDMNIQFPKRIYESDLVSYYQLALSSESQMLSYIAFYKIIEYFFLSASEKVLHRLIADKLIQPEFSHTKSEQLRQLAALIRKHDQRMDEPKMLTTVIEQFFPPTEGEIETWIKEYENTWGAYYTSPQQIFDKTQVVDLRQGEISSSIAKRIYHIRNVLVHNKESDFARFVPFSGQETVLSQEIPLILYLAEQLILKTGKNL